MIKSMTGFGRGSSDSSDISFDVEIKTVNHRYCDLNIRMPKSFMPIEGKIRSLILKQISRGKVDVFITQNDYGNKKGKAILDEDLMESYVDCLNKIKDKYGIKEQPSIDLISKFPDVITLKREDEDLDEIWSVLKVALEDALNMLLNMREKEGAKLKGDIILKCNLIQKYLDKINKISVNLVEEFRNKLRDRIKELRDGYDLDEERIAMEVAIFADKSCIDEEIVRLKSHVGQFQDTLTLDEPVGRKLDFILQEMNREANTIASKSTNLDVTNLVINIKNEIEKIREQIQNIE
ncbi:YicC family protein [Clostridium sp. cel8]|uniref:YicC/YloC family endoribonuclease n=1 Tax=unclassified Clostridium TaxID=2614128 RepID=UPI0015F6F96B|nr:YicC/YloC family endoribonuclease [Clostridium sp. cel8]MBA5850529.1 YicC family protein [Clostridium sp. cel8]